jgi:uncharacterized protein YkwD
MKKWLIGIVVVVILVALGGALAYVTTHKSAPSKTTSAPPTPPAVPIAKQPSVQLDTSEIHSQINLQRTKAGLKALVVNDKLVDSANAKCEDMKKNNYFTHTSPSGVAYTSFIKKSISNPKLTGENLGAGYTDINQLINDWMQSAEHKANILNPKFTAEGIAVCDDSNQKPGLIIVVHFVQI